jgi:hypothetical protein
MQTSYSGYVTQKGYSRPAGALPCGPPAHPLVQSHASHVEHSVLAGPHKSQHTLAHLQAKHARFSLAPVCMSICHSAGETAADLLSHAQ